MDEIDYRMLDRLSVPEPYKTYISIMGIDENL